MYHSGLFGYGEKGCCEIKNFSYLCARINVEDLD